MSKHTDLYMKAVAKDDGEKMCCAVASMLDDIETTDRKLYEQVKGQLEDIAYSISKSDAEVIVRNMVPRGQHWSYKEMEEFCATKGISCATTDYYLVMNMVYNDYYDTASLYGLQNDVEFYYSLSKDFIDDPDGKPHKVARYFTD